MATLGDDVKLFIVKAAAAYDSPETISKAVKEEFGLDVPRQQCAQYDPTKAAGAKLSAKWKAIFNEARAKFLDDVSEIPLANKSVRLRTISRLAKKAEDMKNIPLAAQLIEQAAKEVGNAYTNRRELTGADGKPIATSGTLGVGPVTPEALADAVKQVMNEF